MMIDSARALPYDYAMVGDNNLVPNEVAARVQTPTLVLTAEAAPATAKALVAIMPRAEMKTLRAPTYELSALEIAAAVLPFLS